MRALYLQVYDMINHFFIILSLTSQYIVYYIVWIIRRNMFPLYLIVPHNSFFTTKCGFWIFK